MSKYVILFDTICEGYCPIRDGDGNPVLYETEAEAQAEIDGDNNFYDDCFVGKYEDIGYKSIYTGKETTP